mmetsp:Transcript_132722/g.230131  ORF Transcript_132722/g.230131 Transcript_132722/m.230131 type:complete len:90 (+) Transcript_132722:201-470(+)
MPGSPDCNLAPWALSVLPNPPLRTVYVKSIAYYRTQSPRPSPLADHSSKRERCSFGEGSRLLSLQRTKSVLGDVHLQPPRAAAQDLTLT